MEAEKSMRRMVIQLGLKLDKDSKNLASKNKNLITTELAVEATTFVKYKFIASRDEDTQVNKF